MDLKELQMKVYLCQAAWWRALSEYVWTESEEEGEAGRQAILDYALSKLLVHFYLEGRGNKYAAPVLRKLCEVWEEYERERGLVALPQYCSLLMDEIRGEEFARDLADRSEDEDEDEDEE